MEPWRQLSVQASEDDFDDFRSGSMCCSAVTCKRDFDFCRVCGGQHTMTERRLKCTSKICRDIGPCQTIWKVFTCSAQDSWTIWVNEHGHIRGVVPCSTAHPARITPAMKVFLAEQDEIGIPPRLMLVNLKKHHRTSTPGSTRAMPTLKQIRNALKRIRREQGTKNSRSAIQQLMRLRSYRSGIGNDTAFVFGSKLDRDGYGYVGNGSDEDPFIVGISSLAMIDSCLRFSTADGHCQFHADATFKVSDIGYPVITCGFTDKSRAYQVGAFFVVSRRTAHEYAECSRSFMDLAREVRGVTLKVDTVMGDAEDAQYNAFQSIPAFSEANMLMCFFHVVYNVRKRTQHLPIKDRQMIMTSIIDMHYSDNRQEFEDVRDRELLKWREKSHLSSFADYFQAQWLRRHWKWQSYHTPHGCASTNNPCENLNGALKLFLQRRRHHMRKLILKLCDFIETISPLSPVASDYRAKPSSDIVKAAAGLLETGRVQFETTTNADLVRVLEIAAPISNNEQFDEEEHFRAVFDRAMPSASPGSTSQSSTSRAQNMFLALTSGSDTLSPQDSDDGASSDAEEALEENRQEHNQEEEEEEVRAEKDLIYYRDDMVSSSCSFAGNASCRLVD